MMKLALAALAPAAMALKVHPSDLALALNEKSAAGWKGNGCRMYYTPKYCTETPDMGKFSAALVVSTWKEDLTWLNHMPWSDNMTVMIHDRASTRSHNSVMTIQDNLIIAEESDVKVKALNARRTNPIKFVDIKNKGDEAGAYLQWIIEHYDSLPDATFFIQGHRCADHAKFDMAQALPNLRACFKPDQGYLDLNAYPTKGYTRCTDVPAILERPIMGFKIEHFADIWIKLFHKNFGPMPTRMCYDGYAQFAVSRDTIRKHPLSFYKKLHKGVVDGLTTMEFFWRGLFVPGAMSWEELPKRDRSGKIIVPEYQFSEEELRERARSIDMKGQLNAGHGVM